MKTGNKEATRLLERLLHQGVTEKVFPGAAAAVAQGTESARKYGIAAAGIKDNRFPGEMVREDTFFDLASLSKALSTTLVVYSLVHENKLSLEDTLGQYFNLQKAEEKKDITLEQLLSHSSGLAAYAELFAAFPPDTGTEKRDDIIQSIIEQPLVYPPGTRCLYSDFGFILLGNIVEEITGQSLADLFRSFVTRPTGLEKDIFYIPLKNGRVDTENFAATEDCPWRGRVLRGEVHDEHCRLMNGVSGHAGLFGTAGGVMRLCGHILDQWQQKGNDFAWSFLLKKGLQRQYPGQTWCLGFDSPSKNGSSGGELISADSVGHLGYAGTSFWIDPNLELIIVLLSNRVHPSRENTRIRTYRPFFHTSIIKNFVK
jgi:CubicO group peptidase (beta-lactamase class C family)